MRPTKRFSLLPALLALALLAMPASAQKLEDKVTVHKLPNGLTVLLAERHGTPVFSTVYGFKVGSVDEVQGITGIAHIFEHMAFKGTPRIGSSDFEKEKAVMEEVNKAGRELSLELVKGEAADAALVQKLRSRLAELDQEQKKYIVKDEIDQIYTSAGGTGLNAGTGNDQTMYMISLPANRFELFCLMESERIKNAVLREFYTERSVIQEERKQTTEAVPTRMLNEAFMAAAFQAHPYGHSVVGYASDINSVTLEEAIAFKRKYYCPNNCVLAIVGDVDPKTAIPMIDKYFGAIPRGEEPPVLRTVEPTQLGERRVTYAAQAEPMLMMGFHKPTFPDRDDAILSVISSLLTNGRSSILYKDLVKTRQLVGSIRTSSASPGSRYPNLFTFNAAPRYPHTNEEVEQAILTHLENLKTKPVDEKELQKVKNNLAASLIRSMKSNSGLAFTIIRYQLINGDWKLLFKYKEMVDSVTPADIMACAQKYFTAENRTVAYLVKKTQ